MGQDDLLKITADVVAEYAATNRLSSTDLSRLIHSTYEAFSSLGGPPEAIETNVRETGAVSARKSLADPNFIISMIDGKQYSTLKRHLGSHGLTPERYRAKFGLKSDYPMTAPTYSERRSALAKTTGLGRKPGATVAARSSKAKAKPAKR